MKRILLILIPLAALASLSLLPSCKKTNEYPSHTALVSFPVVTLIGPADTTISRNAVLKDPGATWRDTVTGETGTLHAQAINTSTDSAYLLVYTATNKNGFQATVSRGLGVTNYNGPIDISGLYTDNAGGTDTLIKVARALFYHSDIDLTTNYYSLYGGDPGVIVIKSDSTISASSVYTTGTGTTGAPLLTTLSNASIIYQPAYYYSGTPPHLTAQPPVIFSYTVNIPNVPAVTATFSHN
jgi:hypothetical protein